MNEGLRSERDVAHDVEVALQAALQAGGKPRIDEMIEVLDGERYRQLTYGQALMRFDEADPSEWARRQVVFDALLRFLKLVKLAEKDVGDLLRGVPR